MGRERETEEMVGRRTVTGRREDLAAAGARKAAIVRSRRQQAAEDRRVDRWHRRGGRRKHMAGAGSGFWSAAGSGTGHVWFVPHFIPPKFCHDQNSDQNSGNAKSLAILCLDGNLTNFCQFHTMTSGVHMLLFFFTLKYSISFYRFNYKENI